MSADLQELTGSLARSFAFVGVAVDGDFAVAASAQLPVIDKNPMFRVASLSKIVAGQTFAAGAQAAGIAAPYDVPASDALGWPLVHPGGALVTLGQLASHSAGITDDAGAVVPPDVALAEWVAGKGRAIFGPHPPGTFMSYSNLGYIILAACAERLGGDRFDRLAKRFVLDPWGIAGGFNWSGAARTDRAAALPTFRRDGDQFVPQIDAAVPDAGVILSDGRVFDLTDYAPGWNPAVFAPQGGLRTNLAGMLTLARKAGSASGPRLWQQSDGPGAYLDGLMQDYGLGLQYLDMPPFYPRPLIGHFGNAYGFKGGAWWDAARDTAFAYALNGAEVGDESDALSDAERRIFAAIADREGD